MPRFLLSILLLLAPVVSSNAEPLDDNWWSASFYLDNDLFANSDDGYTNGVRLSFVSPDLEDFENDERLPQWLRSVNHQLSFFRFDERMLKRNMVVTLGQQMFTPDEKYRERTDLVEEDRPYAGWLYLGFGYQVKNYRRMETGIFNIGMIGPSSYAQESQDMIHEARGFEKYQGWDNQIGDELGLQLIYTRRNKWFKSLDRRGWGTDIISHWSGSLGNVATYVEAGGEWRFGWDLSEDFGTSSAIPGGDNSSPGSILDSRVTDEWFGGIHGFMTLSGRWVIHDITLDGNTFKDSHSVDKEPFVATASVGMVMLLSRWKLGFSRVWTTDQFKGQQESNMHGSVFISYTYSF